MGSLGGLLPLALKSVSWASILSAFPMFLSGLAGDAQRRQTLSKNVVNSEAQAKWSKNIVRDFSQATRRALHRCEPAELRIRCETSTIASQHCWPVCVGPSVHFSEMLSIVHSTAAGQKRSAFICITHNRCTAGGLRHDNAHGSDRPVNPCRVDDNRRTSTKRKLPHSIPDTMKPFSTNPPLGSAKKPCWVDEGEAMFCSVACRYL